MCIFKIEMFIIRFQIVYMLHMATAITTFVMTISRKRALCGRSDIAIVWQLTFIFHIGINIIK